MKGCKGVCDRLGSNRPFGDTYATHSFCNRCDAWILLTLLIDRKCPCCEFRPRFIGKKKRMLEAYAAL